METERADVVVVGAGPVGLLLTAELALAGVRPVLIERLATPATERKARGVGPLAAEALRRRGLGPALDAHREEALADLAAAHGSTNAHFAHIHKFRFAPDRDRALIWQPDLERVLTGHAATLGVAVRRGHALTGLRQDADTVTAEVETPDGPRTLTAAYLVGCDGGRSTVRRLAGFAFPGEPPLAVTRVGTVELADPDALPAPGTWETGQLLHGGGLLGTTEYGAGARTGRDDAPLTADELAASVERITGHRPTIRELREPRRFSDAARLVPGYRQGRVLLAGDAAHIHSPNGGQGLDLGLLDAVGLGWRLAATVRDEAAGGRPDDGRLDSYTAERRPAAAAVLRNTMAQSALLTPGPYHDALRTVVSDLMDLPEVASWFAELMSRVHLRYALPGGARPAGPDDPLGRHLPDHTVVGEAGTTTLYALAATGRPLLLHAGDDAVAGTVAGWHDRVDEVAYTRLDGPDDGAADGTALLVRPDGVAAWTAVPGTEPDHAALTAALRTWFGAPVPLTEAGRR